jgi:hypothetical protein
MISHPLLLSVLAMDVLGMLFLWAAAFSAMQIVIGWSAESATGTQILLERRAETASIQGRTGTLLLLSSTLVLVIGITGVLPKLVPGAMCGTGVLQATQGTGGRALAVRGLALGLLALWHLLDRLNRTQPDSPLATGAARALLLAAPAVFLAVLDTLRAFLRLDPHRPVDCCSVIYDQVRSASQAGSVSEIPDAYWIWGLVTGGAVVVFLGATLWRSRWLLGVRRAGLFSLATLLWVPVAATALVRSLAAYHYGVLQHRCPWCLFLPEHRLVGYLLFGALILAVAEAAAPLVCSMVAARLPALAQEAHARARAAGWRLAAAIVLFLALSVLPPIFWRLRFGVWMG